MRAVNDRDCIPAYLRVPSPPYTEALPANQVRVGGGQPLGQELTE